MRENVTQGANGSLSGTWSFPSEQSSDRTASDRPPQLFGVWQEDE